jgi:hypothetical protein
MGSSSGGLPSLRRLMLLTGALLAAGAALLVAPSPSNAETCSDGASADICLSFPNASTNDQGVYTLYIPGGYIGSQPYLYPELKECIWHIKADFGDNSQPWEGTFDTEIGIQTSHQYPSYGIYHGLIDATEGHKPNEAPCESIHIAVQVTFREPAPEEEPVSEPPPSGGPGSGPAGSTSDSAGDGGAHESDPPMIVFWSSCERGIYVHRVTCGKARAVVGKAKRRFTLDLRSVRASGFACHLRPKSQHRISCRRGSRRILAP